MLKIPLLLLGATNLLNKSTQFVLEQDGQQKEEKSSVNDKQYADEPLDQRLKNPQIEGNVLLVDIDNIPRIVTLPPTVVDAYRKGALPLNTLANKILNKSTTKSPFLNHNLYKLQKNMKAIRFVSKAKALR